MLNTIFVLGDSSCACLAWSATTGALSYTGTHANGVDDVLDERHEVVTLAQPRTNDNAVPIE